MAPESIFAGLGYFLFYFPLVMSIAWTIGGCIHFLLREQGQGDLPESGSWPSVTILVPAHNEQDCIEATVNALAGLNYPQYDVIVIDDGSTDETGAILDRLVEPYGDWLRVVRLTPNSGKAKALNVGILLSKGDVIHVLDADAHLDPDALKWLARHFAADPTVGAVTGNPRVLNRTTLLGKIQVGEYSSIIGLIKRAQRLIGTVFTVSGVVVSLRRSALVACQLFDADTVTEDIDVTWRLQRAGWRIVYEPRALCWVLVPETLGGLWRQRLRWAQGGIEVIRKHRSVLWRYEDRRLWPIYVEYVLSLLWCACFVVLFVVAALVSLFEIAGLSAAWLPAGSLSFFIPPRWAGSVLALAWLFQSAASLFIDRHYEKGPFVRYYLYVIWYPFVYWVITAFAAICGLWNVFVTGKGVTVTWASPDRGLHSLKS